MSTETTETTENAEAVTSQERPQPVRLRDTVSIPASLQADPAIHSTTIRLWGTLGLYADDEGRVAMSLNDIARVATFVSQRQALIQIQNMERLGMVEIVRRKDGNRKIPNIYTLLVPKVVTSASLPA